MKTIFATTNKGKLKEMKEILTEVNLEIIDIEQAGIESDIEEDGETFRQNALKKARVVYEQTKLPAIADDSGLCINSLEGAPGIKTARWAGENASGIDLVNYTLEKMKNIKERSAFFKTVAVFIDENGVERTFTGEIHGKIAETPKGKLNPKLPYDVIFIPEEKNKTFAQVSSEEKNGVSHRGKAFKNLKEFLKKKY